MKKLELKERSEVDRKVAQNAIPLACGRTLLIVTWR